MSKIYEMDAMVTNLRGNKTVKDHQGTTSITIIIISTITDHQENKQVDQGIKQLDQGNKQVDHREDMPNKYNRKQRQHPATKAYTNRSYPNTQQQNY